MRLASHLPRRTARARAFAIVLASASLLLACSKPASPGAQGRRNETVDGAQSPGTPPGTILGPPTTGRDAAAPPFREASRAEVERTLESLERWVQPSATDPTNPWILAHGIVAFGKDLRASDGRLAIDVIASDFLEERDIDGRKVYAFPIRGPGSVPVEPHRDLMIKTMVEAGVRLDRELHPKASKKGDRVTLDRLIRDAELAFSIPTDDAGYRNYAWSVSAFLLSRSGRGWVATLTGTIALERISSRTIERLEEEQRFLEAWMDQGRPELVEKRKQGIYGHNCGGFHLVQSAMLAMARSRDPDALRRARRQLDIIFFRWEAERRIYKEALRREPKYRLVLLVQELKFYGHALETLALAEAHGTFRPDAEDRRRIKRIAADLVDTVAALETAYTHQAEVRASSVQTYYDLIGDGCHAIRGLRRSLVASFAP